MAEISKEILDLSEKIKENLTVGEEGVLKTTEGLYVKLLPETLSVETLELLNEHDTKIIAATALAVGTLGISVLKKHPTLPHVTLQMNTVGNDNFNYTFGRSQQVNAGAPTDKEAGQKTKYGTMRISMEKHAMGSRGQLSAVKSFLSDEAALNLGGVKTVKKETESA